MIDAFYLDNAHGRHRGLVQWHLLNVCCSSCRLQRQRHTTCNRVVTADALLRRVREECRSAWFSTDDDGCNLASRAIYTGTERSLQRGPGRPWHKRRHKTHLAGRRNDGIYHRSMTSHTYTVRWSSANPSSAPAIAPLPSQCPSRNHCSVAWELVPIPRTCCCPTAGHEQTLSCQSNEARTANRTGIG